MKYFFAFLMMFFSALTIFGQPFEGEIVYENHYKSKMPNLTDQQFATMMGSRQEYYIKKGDYKSVTNGSPVSYTHLTLPTILRV